MKSALTTNLPAKNSHPRPQDGFVFITVALAVVVLFGMLGLCFDLGRMYITRNELQTYVDSASLMAAMELDGTDQGVINAVTVRGKRPQYLELRQHVDRPGPRHGYLLRRGLRDLR